MTASHHIPEDVLIEHAAGTLPEALSLVVATHAALCPACKANLQALDALGGVLLAEVAAVPVSEGVLAATLARIDGPPAQFTAHPPRPARSDVPTLPEPLRGLVADRPWKRIAPGIRAIELPVRFGQEAAMLTRLEGPFTVPRHGHGGVEAQLVLGGGFSDGPAVFRRGDVQWLDPDDVHQIDIHAGEPCVTLLVKDARLVQHTLKGRLFAWVTGT